MTQRSHFIRGICITAVASVGGIPLIDTSRSGNNSLVAVTQSCNLVVLVAMATVAGVGGITLVSTGRSSHL